VRRALRFVGGGDVREGFALYFEPLSPAASHPTPSFATTWGVRRAITLPVRLVVLHGRIGERNALEASDAPASKKAVPERVRVRAAILVEAAAMALQQDYLKQRVISCREMVRRIQTVRSSR
jgi:hypothetical protein